MPVKTYTMKGLKKELKGNVSETTLEFYKRQQWLVPDHFTPEGIARYTLTSVHDAKVLSVQANQTTAIPVRGIQSMLTPKEAFDEIEIELGLKQPKTHIHKRRNNGKTISVQTPRSRRGHEQRTT